MVYEHIFEAIRQDGGEMKLGTRFTRNGERYEFLGYSGKQSMRVRKLSNGAIVSILANTVEIEIKRKRKAAEAELLRKRKADEAERVRKRKADEAECERLLLEVELLTESVPALRKLRDDCGRLEFDDESKRNGEKPPRTDEHTAESNF